MISLGRAHPPTPRRETTARGRTKAQPNTTSRNGPTRAPQVKAHKMEPWTAGRCVCAQICELAEQLEYEDQLGEVATEEN